MESRARSVYLTPAAVLVGALVIAFAVRAGFREVAEVRRAEAPPASAAAVVASLVPTATFGAPPGVPEQVAAERAERDRAAGLRDRVAIAFGDQAKLYKAACPPRPDPLKPQLPPRIELVFTLDAQGLEVRREIRAVPADSKIVACLRNVKAPPIRIAPPGKESQVALALLLSS